jgi:hypothetical protein
MVVTGGWLCSASGGFFLALNTKMLWLGRLGLKASNPKPIRPGSILSCLVH